MTLYLLSLLYLHTTLVLRQSLLQPIEYPLANDKLFHPLTCITYQGIRLYIPLYTSIYIVEILPLGRG